MKNNIGISLIINIYEKNGNKEFSKHYPLWIIVKRIFSKSATISIIIFNSDYNYFFTNDLSINTKNALAVENSCISYNSIENEISIACQHAEFIDIENSLQDHNMLQRESSNYNQKIGSWMLV